MLVGTRKYQKQIIKTELKRVKNPNWPEANQLATVYKHGRGSELGIPCVLETFLARFPVSVKSL